jgi:hypothetical protein
VPGTFCEEAPDDVREGDAAPFGFLDVEFWGFGFLALDEADADADGVGDVTPGGEGELVSSALATAVAAARAASSLPSGRIVMARQTRRPVTTSPVVVPTISRRLRLR